MTDNIKNDIVKTEDMKYPSVSFVEELGANTAEAICASMRAANDDAPSFGPCITPIPGTSAASSSAHLDATTLAHALTKLREHALPAPFFKGKFMQNYRVILGKEDK